MSRLLTDWAIREQAECVLEPSFGGCGFLEAAIDRLRSLGNREPIEQLSGCDIDKIAFKYLSKLLEDEKPPVQFIKGDFLSLKLSDFRSEGFHVILGNPPYVSYHNMFFRQRQAVESAGEFAGFRLSRLASLWAHMVLHSVKFVRHQGRMAWLLPGSLLNANYAKKLLKELAKHFQRVVVISVVQRLFEEDGTDESSEVLLCENFGMGPAANGVEIQQALDVEDCRRLLGQWSNNSWQGNTLNGRIATALVPKEDLSEFFKVCGDHHVSALGDISQILIGVVTGANSFFILNESEVAENGLPGHTTDPILAKFSHAKGLSMKRVDLKSIEQKGFRCLLLNTTRTLSHPAIRKYLRKFPQKEKHKNATFRKRRYWHRPVVGSAPDAFFPYMHHSGPRLVLNTCRTNSTNTIHRVYFRKELPRSTKQLAAISLISTFSQLSAEIEGRTYGSGVLKHEPSEAAQIKLILPEVSDGKMLNKVFKLAETYIREGFDSKAQDLVDEFFCNAVPDVVNVEKIRQWKQVLVTLRQRRYSNLNRHQK